MKIITYLAFTVLSIAIQFVVMDYIQEKVNNDIIDLNVTSQKKTLYDVLQQYTQKPQALYYHTQKVKQIEKSLSSSMEYSNSSIKDVESTTILSSTLIDLLYDENTTIIDDTFTTATESLYTSTEFGNVTEITLFGKTNTTEIKPKKIPKKTAHEDCKCNLSYKVCDINCCCDEDCTVVEREMFVCANGSAYSDLGNNFCSSQYSYSSYLIGSNIDQLICVVKSNLPDKKDIYHTKHDPLVINKFFKWHSNAKRKDVQVFTKSVYKFGDPIWLIRNGTINYMDVPTTAVNNYCSNRKPINFLKNQNMKCIVKLSDLETLQILNIVDDTSVISVTEKSSNSSIMNCSTLHCTNWTIMLCDELICTKYKKELHIPICTESVCSNIALKVDYIFNYYSNKIMNATIKLYTQNVPFNVLFIEQQINVKFVIGNESDDNIVEYSGNPGYITGLPVIVSYNEKNHSKNFYNNTSKQKYLAYPDNENGACTQYSKKNVLFGINKRMKCRYYHLLSSSIRNATNVCKNIQNNITSLFGIDHEVAVSPLGNPHSCKDEDWIHVKVEMLEKSLYGELNSLKTKLHCYNLITRFSFVFTFAGVGEAMTKILSAKVDVNPANATFNIEDMSIAVTIDTIFIDETKPTAYEYAGGPQLNIHLPRDFFFPFQFNKGFPYPCNMHVILLICLFNLFFK